MTASLISLALMALGVLRLGESYPIIMEVVRNSQQVSIEVFVTYYYNYT